PKSLIRSGQLGGTLLRKQLPLARHRCSHFFGPLQVSDVHYGTNEFKRAGGADQGLTKTPDELNRSIREHDSIMVFEVALVLHRPIEKLFEGAPILRMNSFHEQRMGGRVGFRI